MAELVVMFLGLLTASTLLSMFEVSILTINPVTLDRLVEKRPYLSFFDKRKESAASQVLIVNFLVDYLGAMALSAMIAQEFEGNKAYLMGASLITSLATLYIATLTAKLFANKNADRVIYGLGWMIISLHWTLRPAVILLSAPIMAFLRGWLNNGSESKLSDGELLGVLSLAKKEGLLRNMQHNFIKRLIDMQGTSVGELVPADQKVESVNIEANILELKDKMLKGCHKRLVVTKTHNNEEYPIGILMFKDIVRINVAHLEAKAAQSEPVSPPTIASVMHPCVVTQSSSNAEVLMDKLDKGDHIVVVVDDKSGVLRGVLQSDDIIHLLTN